MLRATKCVSVTVRLPLFTETSFSLPPMAICYWQEKNASLVGGAGGSCRNDESLFFVPTALTVSHVANYAADPLLIKPTAAFRFGIIGLQLLFIKHM